MHTIFTFEFWMHIKDRTTWDTEQQAARAFFFFINFAIDFEHSMTFFSLHHRWWVNFDNLLEFVDIFFFMRNNMYSRVWIYLVDKYFELLDTQFRNIKFQSDIKRTSFTWIKFRGNFTVMIIQTSQHFPASGHTYTFLYVWINVINFFRSYFSVIKFVPIGQLSNPFMNRVEYYGM